MASVLKNINTSLNESNVLSNNENFVTESDLTIDLSNVYTKAQTDTLLNGKSNTGHDHSTIYYDKTYMDTALAGKSNTGHDHSTIYYDKTYMDTALAGKSDTGHDHSTIYYTKTYIDTSLYLKYEVDDLLLLKSDTSHNHDSNYYTKSYIDTYIYLKSQVDSLIASYVYSQLVIANATPSLYLKSADQTTTHLQLNYDGSYNVKFNTPSTSNKFRFDINNIQKNDNQ